MSDLLGFIVTAGFVLVFAYCVIRAAFAEKIATHFAKVIGKKLVAE